jgi:hypothetical protein
LFNEGSHATKNTASAGSYSEPIKADKAYLNFSNGSRRVHSRRHVDSVAPDVVLRLLGTDDSGYDWPNADA